jgi:hypothetical protein
MLAIGDDGTILADLFKLSSTASLWPSLKDIDGQHNTLKRRDRDDDPFASR